MLATTTITCLKCHEATELRVSRNETSDTPPDSSGKTSVQVLAIIRAPMRPAGRLAMAGRDEFESALPPVRDAKGG
jgi:hypothetical protein